MSGEKNRMIYSWAYHIHPGKPAWSWVSPPQKWDVWHRNMAMIFAVCCKSAGHNGLSTLHVGVTLFTQDLWNCTLTGQMQLPWHLRYQFNNQGPRLSSVYSLIVICSSNQMKKNKHIEEYINILKLEGIDVLNPAPHLPVPGVLPMRKGADPSYC